MVGAPATGLLEPLSLHCLTSRATLPIGADGTAFHEDWCASTACTAAPRSRDGPTRAALPGCAQHAGGRP